VEQPATGQSADNTQQDVEQDALTSPIYNHAADEIGNQTENHPNQKYRLPMKSKADAPLECGVTVDTAPGWPCAISPNPA
jgi:hypothetical protein